MLVQHRRIAQHVAGQRRRDEVEALGEAFRRGLGLSGGRLRRFAEALAPLPRAGGAARERRLLRRSAGELLVVAAQQIFAIGALQVLVGDLAGGMAQAPLQGSAALGRVQRSTSRSRINSACTNGVVCES